MNITEKQDGKYWRLWSAVRRIRPDADRHALHIEALGYDKSHKDMTNGELDKVFAEFTAIIDPAGLDKQMEFRRQPRKRLLYSIAHLAPAAYTGEILRVRFQGRALEDLDQSGLVQLRNTLAARMNAQRHRAAQSEYAHAGVEAAADNDPF